MTPLAIPFLQAHSGRYKDLTGQPKRPWRVLVLHDMEAPEAQKTPLNVANWFHSAPTPATSAHYCVGADSIVQCVQLRDVAYGAPNANRDGVHIELAGYAAQTHDQWLDAYSKAMLLLAARLIREVVCPKTGIPVEFVDHDGLAAGRWGITTHREVSLWIAAHGLPGDHSHTDPGPNFPMEDFLAMVRG